MKGDETEDGGATQRGRQADSARSRGEAPSVRLARTGAEIANGAKSLGAAMIAAGYSPWTARIPTATGITVAKALAAAATLAPNVGHTLRSHGRKADKIIDKTLTLRDGEDPDSLQIQTAIQVKRLEQDSEEPEETGNAARWHWRQRRTLRKLMAVVIRSVERDGAEAVRARLAAIVESDEQRFPYPFQIVALDTTNFQSQRAKLREKRHRKEDDQ